MPTDRHYNDRALQEQPSSYHYHQGRTTPYYRNSVYQGRGDQYPTWEYHANEWKSSTDTYHSRVYPRCPPSPTVSERSDSNSIGQTVDYNHGNATSNTDTVLNSKPDRETSHQPKEDHNSLTDLPDRPPRNTPSRPAPQGIPTGPNTADPCGTDLSSEVPTKVSNPSCIAA